MSEKIIEIENVFFKVFIGEILDSEKERAGFRVYLYVKWNDTFFKVRKVRFIGRVADITLRERFTDLLIVDPTGEIIVRGWDERKKLLDKFDINDLVEVFGTIRVYGDEIYINPLITQKVLEENAEKRKKEIEENRKYILEVYRMKMNA